MFDVLKSLTKAAVGVVVDVPLSIVADVVTLGALVTEEDQPYTVTAAGKVLDNVKEAINGTGK